MYAIIKKVYLFQLIAFKIEAIIKDSLLLQLVAMNIYWQQSLRDVPWNQFNSENIEILYLLSALKEPVQIDCKKACSVMEQAWISTFCRHIC